MRSIPPDSNAFSLSFRNFDPLPERHRRHWLPIFQQAYQLESIPWPTRAIVELANTCNLDCPMCRVGREGVDLRRVMTLDRFRRLASELFPLIRDVRLNGLGESTVIPAFTAYLDVLDDFDVSVELITNGTGALATYERLVERGATLLFSWDAASPSLFERLRRPARWDVVTSTLIAVARHARDKSASELLHLLFTLQAANVRELRALVERAAAWNVPNVVVNVAKLGNNGWFAPVADDVREELHSADEVARTLGIRLFLPDQILGMRIDTASACPTSASGCDRPWKEVVVRWDLDVQVCNMFNPYVYGNLALHSFERIWRGAFARTFRQHVNGPMPHPYCEDCAYIGDVYGRSRS